MRGSVACRKTRLGWDMQAPRASAGVPGNHAPTALRGPHCAAVPHRAELPVHIPLPPWVPRRCAGHLGVQRDVNDPFVHPCAIDRPSGPCLGPPLHASGREGQITGLALSLALIAPHKVGGRLLTNELRA